MLHVYWPWALLSLDPWEFIWVFWCRTWRCWLMVEGSKPLASFPVSWKLWSPYACMLPCALKAKVSGLLVLWELLLVDPIEPIWVPFAWRLGVNNSYFSWELLSSYAWRKCLILLTTGFITALFYAGVSCDDWCIPCVVHALDEMLRDVQELLLTGWITLKVMLYGKVWWKRWNCTWMERCGEAKVCWWFGHQSSNSQELGFTRKMVVVVVRQEGCFAEKDFCF